MIIERLPRANVRPNREKEMRIKKAIFEYSIGPLTKPPGQRRRKKPDVNTKEAVHHGTTTYLSLIHI